MSSTDLFTRIADYYKASGHETEFYYTILPTVATFLELPKEAKEGDVRRVKEMSNEYIFDEGEWVALPQDDDEYLTKKDVNKTLEDNTASTAEVLEALRKGEEAANNE